MSKVELLRILKIFTRGVAFMVLAVLLGCRSESPTQQTKTHTSAPDVSLVAEKTHQIYSNHSFTMFAKNVNRQKLDLIRLLQELKKSGKRVIGYGASTKGNVILQFCDIGPDLLPFIGDITPFKDGVFTPGTKIPVISMEKAKNMKPDYFLVLPWAFRNDILLRETETILNGTKFIFPLPFVEIIS